MSKRNKYQEISRRGEPGNQVLLPQSPLSMGPEADPEYGVPARAVLDPPEESTESGPPLPEELEAELGQAGEECAAEPLPPPAPRAPTC